MIAGLISFPILTRMLPVEQYGLLSLISTTLTFLVVFGKVGLQHSAVRFYSDTLSKEGAEYSFEQFSSTTFFSMLGAGVVAALLWIVFYFVSPEGFWGNAHSLYLLGFTSVLVMVRVLMSAFINITKAKEMSGFTSTYQVILKYATLGCTVLTLFFISSTVTAVFGARMVVDSCALLALIYLLYRKFEIKWQAFSSSLFKSMLFFGLPMLGFELAGATLNIGDRYVINWLLDTEAVGVYAASYNLCEQVRGVIAASVVSAILPMYLRIYAEDGEAPTREFIKKGVHIYALMAFPLIALLSGLGSELIVLLASERYLDGTLVIPYVIVGMMISGVATMISPGLQIKKQSILMMALVAIAAIMNVALNFFLIPDYGIEGAGMATLISLLFLVTITYRVSCRYFDMPLPWVDLVKVALAAVVMYLVMEQISVDGLIYNLLLKGAIGVVTYLVAVFLIDNKSRDMVAAFVSKRINSVRD